jgi:predicted AAA+ superfamily ATPase
MRKPALLEKILTALAFQIGNEILFFKLSQTAEADRKTIEHYIQLLEKSFVIFNLIRLVKICTMK